MRFSQLVTMVHVQALYFLKLVQEQHGIGRVVTVPLQLGNNVALAGDHALALHNMALSLRQVFLEHRPVHMPSYRASA
jgi:hypothetical protein